MLLFDQCLGHKATESIGGARNKYPRHVRFSAIDCVERSLDLVNQKDTDARWCYSNSF